MNRREDRSGFRTSALRVLVCVLSLNAGSLLVVAEECTRDECLKEAGRLRESMNVGVDPCQDFAEFSCGGAYEKYDDESRRINDWSTESAVAPRGRRSRAWWIRRHVVDELNEPHRAEEPRTIGLAKTYWQSCRMTSAREALAGVRILFKRLGGWPLITPAWREKRFAWDRFGKCARLLGFLPRMFLHVGLNDEDVDKPWFANDSIELTVERSKYAKTREDMIGMMERATEYFKTAEYLAESKKPDMAEIREALEFGKRLHLLTHAEEMPIIERKVMSIAELQRTYPLVDWMDYVRSMLTKRQADYLSDRSCATVDVCYLSRVGDLLKGTSKRVQANYAFLSIVDDLSLFIRPQLSLTFAASQREIDQICFDSVLSIFRKAIEMIVARMAGQRLRRSVNEMRTVVAERARRIFRKVPWMDDRTRSQAASKSEKTTFVDLFTDDVFEDAYFDRLEFTQPNATLVLFREANVFLVDRYYLQLGRPRNPYILHRGTDDRTTFAVFKTPFSSAETSVRPDRISNQVYIPAGAALDGRFGAIPELAFANYAKMGLEIANAMSHQIYERGAFVDSEGHWREASWWSEDTRRQFAARRGCSDIGTIEPLDRMSPTFGLIGAAEIAYESMASDSSSASDVTLPGLKFTRDQLFWIAAVASDCERASKDRYNAMVAHSVNFSRDFGCPIGSKMNLADKCPMWV